MHAKVTVADDTVFVGSFNLSRSGEMNAENVLEIHDPGARRADGGLRRRGPRALPARPRCPSRAHGDDLLRTSSASVGISRSAGEIRPGSSSSARIHSSSPDQYSLPDQRHRVVDRLAGLDQGEHLEHLVERPEAAREGDDEACE